MPEEPSYRQNTNDAVKLAVDIAKHITTLSTGSIIILVTFLEKTFSNPIFGLLIIFAFLCFILSIITALKAMRKFAPSLNLSFKRTKIQVDSANTWYTWSYCFFVIGVFLFAVFGSINIYFNQ